jgi:hypothetical protein
MQNEKRGNRRPPFFIIHSAEYPPFLTCPLKTLVANDGGLGETALPKLVAA